MENIDQHIEKDLKILEDPTTSPQARRHTQQELDSLNLYKKNNPEKVKDPTPLELFCNENPHADECRIYDV
jgi:hypothetical protein